MDIYTELKKDHRELLRLVRHILQVNTGDVPGTRRELLDELTDRFGRHLHAKKKYFYPVVAGSPEHRAEAEQAELAQEEIEAGLKDLHGFDPGHKAWMAHFKPLAERIQRQIDREEQTLMREFRERVNPQTAMDYGRFLRETEEQRPRPD